MSKSETRECLIKAAKVIFSEVGYEAATTREIAIRANVNEITLFRHFGTSAPRHQIGPTTRMYQSIRICY